MAASSFYLATSWDGATVGDSVILVESGAGGTPDGDDGAAPTTGQIWPRGNP